METLEEYWNSSSRGRDFNADEFGENGLYHPQAPEFDDVWYFNIAKISSSGALPTWNWTLDSSSL